MLTVGLFVQAIQKKQAPNYIFSLSEIPKDVAGRMAIYDESMIKNKIILDMSDWIIPMK